MLKTDVHKNIAYITLDRPDVHNAFNDELIARVTEAFTDLSQNDVIRVIVLCGNGKSFCAGGDLNWMKKMIQYTREENLEDARALARMFLAVTKCPKPVIARVHGAALGGGAGLVAACDIGIAVESAQFGFTEVKLGIIPGVISPFVMARIGPGHARELFLTGERFLAAVACNVGLIQHVVAHELALDALIDSKISQIMTSAPGAIAAAKELIFGVAARTLESSLEFTADAIARARISPEGQAGMKAFLERQKPPWIEKTDKNDRSNSGK
ncbi:MAG: enoyl-CoA hydratase/isomerase family protein [Acidobacteria bacterium]|nr:enoyl-CoA hydratase/isomerase family protein [Acidobacteriota bacterium]